MNDLDTLLFNILKIKTPIRLASRLGQNFQIFKFSKLNKIAPIGSIEWKTGELPVRIW